jgi:hypothetical protein
MIPVLMSAIFAKVMAAHKCWARTIGDSAVPRACVGFLPSKGRCERRKNYRSEVFHSRPTRRLVALRMVMAAALMMIAHLVLHNPHKKPFSIHAEHGLAQRRFSHATRRERS